MPAPRLALLPASRGKPRTAVSARHVPARRSRRGLASLARAFGAHCFGPQFPRPFRIIQARDETAGTWGMASGVGGGGHRSCCVWSEVKPGITAAAPSLFLLSADYYPPPRPQSPSSTTSSLSWSSVGGAGMLATSGRGRGSRCGQGWFPAVAGSTVIAGGLGYIGGLGQASFHQSVGTHLLSFKRGAC